MKKISYFFAVLILLLSVIVSQLLPVVAETVTENSTETVQATEGSLTASTIPPLVETSESSMYMDEPQVVEEAAESEEVKEPTSQSNEIGKQKQEVQDKSSARNLRADISNEIEMLEWKISNSQGQEIDETLGAVSNQSHDLFFKIKLNQLIKGDTFALDIPQVGGAVREGDHWYMQGTDWIEVSDDQGNVFYRYKVQHKSGTHTQEIKFEIKETSLTTAELELNLEGMLSNFVKTAGVFPVTFGKNAEGDPMTKNLKFDVTDLSASKGFSFKYSTSTSKNSVKWGIRFNEAANIELSGDEVDYKVNGGENNPYQGFYRDNPLRKPENWHEWGKQYTDIWSPDRNNQSIEANYGGYVEDELPAGAEVTELTIAGLVNLPMGLSESDLENQTGGIPASTTAYQSFVLADYGRGPTYRSAGDTGTLKPKTGTGFTLLKQSPGESKSAFKERVQAQPYQYGLYQDGAGRKTVMIHFGNMKKTGNQQEKLHDQTDQKYSGKEFVDKDGITRQIPQFAVEAAAATIGDQRSGYTEEDRNLLERYFTLTYGESNAIGGSIAAYNISLNVRYPPETAGVVTNSADIYTHSALTLNRTTPERMPKNNGNTATLKNPTGNIQLSKTEVLLQKLDADLFTSEGDYIGINGAKFKLQKKVGTAWEDVGNPVKEFTTADYTYTEEGVEKILPGIIKIDVAQILGVSGGSLKDTFRFVETEAPPGFSERDSPNWNNQAQAIVSAEFTLASSTSQGATVIVWNRHKEITYKVEHWVQKDGFDGSNISHFEKVVTEEKDGLVGDTVYGKPLDSLQITHYYNAIFTRDNGIPSGVITDPSTGDPELVLKLYYTKDEAIPFTIYKLGMNEEPLPSTEDYKVRFKAYSFAYKKLPGGTDTTVTSHPPTPENIQQGFWRRIVIVDDNTLAWTTNNEDTRKELILTTDSQGRIRDKRFNRDKIGGTIALVEINNDYPDYNPPPTANEAYWVFYLSESDKVNITNGVGYGNKGYLETQYKPEGSTKNHYAIKNKFEVAPKIFKVDEKDQPMPSSDEQSVEFDVYEYIGEEDIRPDKVKSPFSLNIRDLNNPLSTRNVSAEITGRTGTYADRWTKIAASPCRTDENGQIVDSDGHPLSLDPQKLYSFIETKTYKGYQVPNNQSWNPNRANHWLVSLSGELKTGSSGFVDSRPVQFLANMYEKASDFSVSKEGIYLKNRKLTKIPIFKVDENLNPINQHSADQFKFETYLFDNTTASDNYQSFPLTDWRWRAVSKNTLADSFDSSGSGRLFTEDDSLETKIGRTEVVKEQIVGIREVKGMHDYVKNNGYWVVKLVWDPVAKVNQVTSIEYFENGQLVTGEDSTEYHELLDGEAYLKNHRIPTHDFSFIKENEQQQPLGNVWFTLYKEKNTTGSEDPNAADTRWDLSEEPYREAISSLDIGNTGTVTFKGLIAGSYLLVETKTVEGYQLPQGYWILTVNDQGNVTIRGSTDPQPPAFYEKNDQLYLPNYKATIMPKAGGIGLHVVVSMGIFLLGLSALVMLESKKRPFIQGIKFALSKLKK